MIAGLVAMRDLDDLPVGSRQVVEGAPVWHLVDISTWPLRAACGHHAPDPMRRRLRRVERVAAGPWCPACQRLAA